MSCRLQELIKFIDDAYQSAFKELEVEDIYSSTFRKLYYQIVIENLKKNPCPDPDVHIGFMCYLLLKRGSANTEIIIL